jgi:hypothetical protein
MDYPERYNGSYVPLDAITWDIRREGRGWHGDEFEKSFWAMPEKMEATDGKIYYDEEDRLKVLGALLENIGIDRVLRFGDPALWRQAVADLPD